MVFEVVGLSLLIGKLRGGSIRNLEKLNVKGWYFFIIAFIMEFISILAVGSIQGSLSRFIINNVFIIHTTIYILVILGFLSNIKEKWLRVSLVGTILNFIPIFANGGKMPVSINGLSSKYSYNQIELLKSNKILTHKIITENTKFYYLSDLIPIPRPYLFPKIISIGDIIISIGIFFLIQSYMKYSLSKVNMINFSGYHKYN